MLEQKKCSWVNKIEGCQMGEDLVEIVTNSDTDLWQKTYGGASADNAPMLLWDTTDCEFTFTAKVEYESSGLYDQAGIILYQDENTWMKASMECENEVKHLGSVATNMGFSDWAAVDVSIEKTSMWYRMNRKGDDFLLEYSEDGISFSVLRMCHIFNLKPDIRFGLYACSPKESSFKAVFTELDYRVN